MDAQAVMQEFNKTCVRCGICGRTDCGNFFEEGLNLGEICESLLSGDEYFRHFPYTCAMCGRCTAHCPVDLHANDMCKAARILILEKHPELRGNYAHFRTDLKYNFFSMMQGLQRGDIASTCLIEKGEATGTNADKTAFFPGCSLDSFKPELSQRTFKWLQDEGIANSILHFCCGSTFWDSGFNDEFEAYRKSVCAFLQKEGIERIVLCCPHCAFILPDTLEGTGIELVRMPDLLVEHGVKVHGIGKVSFHDACYDRLEGKFGSAIRELFSESTINEMPHNGLDTLCCGGGGMVSAYAPDYCTYRRNQRLDEIDAVDADAVVSSCFSCVNSLQRGDFEKPIKHYLELVFDMDADWDAINQTVEAVYSHADCNAMLADQTPLFEAE